MGATRTAQQGAIAGGMISGKDDETSRVILTEYFQQVPLANSVAAISATCSSKVYQLMRLNRNFELFGTGTAGASFTKATHETDGALELTTGATDNDYTGISPHADTEQSAWTDIDWTPNKKLAFRVVVRLDSIANIHVAAGLQLTAAGVVADSTDADCIRFDFDTDDTDTKWTLMHSVAGTDTSLTSAVTVAADTTYVLEIVTDTDGKADAFINGEKVNNTPIQLTTTAALIPCVAVQTRTTAAKTLDIYPPLRMSKNIA